MMMCNFLNLRSALLLFAVAILAAGPSSARPPPQHQLLRIYRDREITSQLRARYEEERREAVRQEENRFRVNRFDYVRDDVDIDDIIRLIEENEERGRAQEWNRVSRQERILDLSTFELGKTEVGEEKKSQHADKNCAICLESIDSGNLIAELKNCGHVFHEECIMKWSQMREYLKRPSLCPVCRKSFQVTTKKPQGR